MVESVLLRLLHQCQCSCIRQLFDATQRGNVSVTENNRKHLSPNDNIVKPATSCNTPARRPFACSIIHHVSIRSTACIARIGHGGPHSAVSCRSHVQQLTVQRVQPV